MIHDFKKLNSKKPETSWITSAEDLMETSFPPRRDLIPDIIPEGGTILASSPKIGKTWLMLNIAVAVSTGGNALGSIKVPKGSVLYLALEDGQRRIQERLTAMLNGGPVPKLLNFAWSCLPITQGGEQLIESWILTAHDPRLVVVDTIKRVRPEIKSNKPLYDFDYEVFAPLNDLSHKYHISIIGNHHDRKMEADDVLDTVSGSHGLTGSCDAVLVLQRTRAQTDGTLHVISRDGTDSRKALKFEYPNWILEGDADKVRQSAERKEMLDLITGASKPLSPKEIADLLGKDYSATKQLLWKMSKQGQLAAKGGKYEVLDLKQHIMSMRAVK